MNKLNLKMGNPGFLQEYWRGQDLPETEFYYPHPYMDLVQSEELEKAIVNIHETIGNVKNPSSYKIVIGNGASQLISAAVWANRLVYWGKMISAPIPYFSRFPELVSIGGAKWATLNNVDEKILTAPNNPDGTFTEYSAGIKRYGNKIIDACYNWPQYVNKVKKLDDELIIFSLSKATGHAGTRLGWALVKNESVAKEMKNFVENNTMGVSQLAQDIGRFVLAREGIRYKEGRENVFEYGKTELESRWKKLKTLNLPFEVLSKNGMFLWCSGDVPNHVEGINGKEFGDTEDKFRLNIGCIRFDFNKLIGPYET